ncbi:MAG: hypothetical protein J5556_00720 [Deltaproteobacteria bacterium]|nr:hypothetical protein [Deltaproteobacteria bacterium]
MVLLLLFLCGGVILTEDIIEQNASLLHSVDDVPRHLSLFISSLRRYKKATGLWELARLWNPEKLLAKCREKPSVFD